MLVKADAASEMERLFSMLPTLEFGAVCKECFQRRVLIDFTGSFLVNQGSVGVQRDGNQKG